MAKRRPGKKAKRQLPKCPQCAAPLRTALAKQCFKCGANWHAPSDPPKDATRSRSRDYVAWWNSCEMCVGLGRGKVYYDCLQKTLSEAGRVTLSIRSFLKDHVLAIELNSLDRWLQMTDDVARRRIDREHFEATVAALRGVGANRVAEVLLERSQEKQLPLPHMMFMQTAPERTQPIITTEELESLLENYAVRNQTELDADIARHGDPRRADGVNANTVLETRKSKERQLALRAQQDGRLPNLHRKLNSFRAALSDASSRGVQRTAYSLAVECEESWSDRRALSDEAERLLHDAEALLQKHWQSRIGDLTDQLAALGEISFDVSGQPHVMSALPAFEPFGEQVIYRDNASPRGYLAIVFDWNNVEPVFTPRHQALFEWLHEHQYQVASGLRELIYENYSSAAFAEEDRFQVRRTTDRYRPLIVNGDELDGLFRVISINLACGDSAGQDAIVIELDQAWDDEHSWAFKLQGLDNNGLGEWSVAWD